MVFVVACSDRSATIDARSSDAASGDASTAFDAAPCSGTCGSIRFRGQGDSYGDRVRMRLDDPATTTAGPALDVGATDFTIELWLLADAAANPNSIACGAGIGWTSSNIVVDRDRHSQSPSFGIGLQARRVVFAVVNGSALSLCGDAVVADGAWHHVAVDRRRSDGRMRIWVDGALDASADGPDGDLSYPDDGVPLSVCPRGACTDSDPFLVIGAEKHGYPGISFTGLVDELRVSSTLRHDGAFARATAPFDADAETVGLFHFDEDTGLVAVDSAGSVDGELVLGGVPPSPTWTTDTPFLP